MTYDEAFSITQELRARFDAPFSSLDKVTIERLYDAVLGKHLKKTNCQQCYHDALIEIYLYLKRENKMAERSKYVMRAGFIIHSPLFKGGKVFTNDNLTDEVAEEYMEMFPNKKPMFDKRKNFVSNEVKTPEVVNDTPTKKKGRKSKKNAK